MPYTIRKQKCKQSDGDAGSHVLSYTDKSGKKHRACHTSKRKAQGQIAAIEGQWEADKTGDKESVMTEKLLREMVRELLRENNSMVMRIIDAYIDHLSEYRDGHVPVSEIEDDMGGIEIRDNLKTKLTQNFDFYYNPKIDEDEMILRPSGVKGFVAAFLQANPDFVKKSPGGADVRFGLSSGLELTPEQIRAAIENVDGATIDNEILPGDPGSKSGKYMTYQIVAYDGSTVDAVFSTKPVQALPRFDSRGVPTYSGGAEAMQINAMNNALREVMGPGGINVQLGSRPPLKNVGAIIQVGGNPKADAYFAPMRDGMVDRSSPMAYISLKNAGSPSAMQQWSGISKFMDYPEVPSFINELEVQLAAMGSVGIMPHGPSFRSEFPVSEELALKACWGASYAPGKSGTQSVDMIYICSDSSVALRKVEGNTYEFTGGVSLYDGELPPDGWAPYLYARKGERSDAGITGARIAIFPRDYRSSPVII
jgi:hypothetical protein